MKIERLCLRIIVSAIVGGIAGLAMYAGFLNYGFNPPGGNVVPVVLFLSIFLTGPIVATALAHALTPRETKDGHTRCGKCGYILKGLTEPRCSECGERI